MFIKEGATMSVVAMKVDKQGDLEFLCQGGNCGSSVSKFSEDQINIV
jgi:hypothetical protein